MILYAADLHGDGIVMIDLASGSLIKRWKSGPRPYRLLLDGKRCCDQLGRLVRYTNMTLKPAPRSASPQWALTQPTW